MKAPTQHIVIIGASSFIGQHLAKKLAADNSISLRFLRHNQSVDRIVPGRMIDCVQGNLLEQESLKNLLIPGCTVINLAFLQDAPDKDNLTAIDNLAHICRNAQIKRLVHCSTAVVVGRTSDHVITEKTPCLPSPGYERVKFDIERALITASANHFELAIFRPTAVFGRGGKNLIKLARDVSHGNKIVNYFKSCLHNQRKMNLVCIDNVTSALKFLACSEERMNQEIFIISDDDSPANNYHDIEVFLMNRLGYTNYSVPKFPIPKSILSLLLKLAGKSSINPGRIYDSSKILKAGFIKSVSFDEGLELFADWYLQLLNEQKNRNS